MIGSTCFRFETHKVNKGVEVTRGNEDCHSLALDLLTQRELLFVLVCADRKYYQAIKEECVLRERAGEHQQDSRTRARRLGFCSTTSHIRLSKRCRSSIQETWRRPIGSSLRQTGMEEARQVARCVALSAKLTAFGVTAILSGSAYAGPPSLCHRPLGR